jgi:hypothetical protein
VGDSQAQTAGEASTLIQAGGNVTVSIGVSYADLDLAINQARKEIAEEVLAKAQEMLRAAGIQPAPVALKTVVTLFQYASLEEDPDLQTKWASLLANTADPRSTDAARPTYIEILRELTPTDALFIDCIYQNALNQMQVKHVLFTEVKFDIFQLKQVYDFGVLKYSPPAGAHLGIAVNNEFHARLDVLGKLGILDVAFAQKNKAQTQLRARRWSLSNLGWCFLRACRPPSQPRPPQPNAEGKK